MANIAVGDKVLVTLNMRLCGQVCLNTQRYRVSAVTPSTPIDTALLGLIAQLRMAAGWIAKAKLVYPSNLRIVEAWAQVVLPTRYRKTVTAINEDGTFAGDAMSANTAAVVTRFSDVASRHGISNVHLPIALNGDSTIDGELDPTFKGLVEDVGLAMSLNVITAAPAVTFIPVTNWSGLTAQSDIVGAYAQDTTRVMRRRTVRVGI